MDAALRQRFVDGRFPMIPLFLRPMCAQIGDLFIPLWRQSRTPIRDRCFAVVFAVGNNADLNLVSGERRSHNYVFYPAVPNVVCREQPESIAAVAAARSEYDALALYALCRVNKTRRPLWRPFCLAYGSKKRRYIRDRAVQYDCERLCPLFNHRRPRLLQPMPLELAQGPTPIT